MGVVCECERVRVESSKFEWLFSPRIFSRPKEVVFKDIDMRTLPSRQLNHTAGICGVVSGVGSFSPGDWKLSRFLIQFLFHVDNSVFISCLFSLCTWRPSNGKQHVSPW